MEKNQLIDQWVMVARQIARHRWPVVHVPLPPQRKVGEDPELSTSLYWPGKDGREGAEYVLERGPNGQHIYWIGNARVARYADHLAVERAIAECEKTADSIRHMTAMARKDRKYHDLLDIVNALVLTGRVHRETVDELGEFSPLIAVCFELQQIAEVDWPGIMVRRLVESMMDGKLPYADVTVSRENGRLAGVKAQICPGLFIVFHFWGDEWTSPADCWFGVPTDDGEGLQPIGGTYRDQVWHISHICESPGDAFTLLKILATIREFLEE